VNQISTDAPGTVISTDPSPGALVKKGDTITLHKAVAAPVAKVQVPAGITNTSVSEAEATLRGVGLTYTVVNRTNNATKGTVLSTNPTSGTTVKVGSSVTLTVSAGPADVQVPSVIGQTELAAGNLLGSVGLNASIGTPQSSTQYGPGLVIISTPGPGALVPPGSSVTIVVSTGPPPTTTTTPPTTTSPSTTTPSSTTTTNPGPGGAGQPGPGSGPGPGGHSALGGKGSGQKVR
jgi:serine/threonine-protein kinase